MELSKTHRAALISALETVTKKLNNMAPVNTDDTVREYAEMEHYLLLGQKNTIENALIANEIDY